MYPQKSLYSTLAEHSLPNRAYAVYFDTINTL